MLASSQDLLIFVIEKQRFAIHLHNVDRIERAVSVTLLKDSPGFIEGIIDYYGEIIAVINLRKRLGYPLQELKLSDLFIIVKTPNRKIALIVDEFENVLSQDAEDLSDLKDIVGGLKFMNILRDDNGIILVYDIENLLENSEEIELKHLLETNLLSGEGL